MLNQRWESSWSSLLHLSRFPLFFLHVSYFKFAAREKPHFCATSVFFLESEYWLSCFFLQRKTVCPLPRTQTSLPRWKFARKGRREGENGRDFASTLTFLFPIVPCASSSVTRESLVFSLASVWKTWHLRRRQICPPKKLERPPWKLLTGTDCFPKVKQLKLVHNFCFMLYAVLSMNYLTLENVSITTKKTYTRSDPYVSDSHDSSRHFAHYSLQKLIFIPISSCFSSSFWRVVRRWSLRRNGSDVVP